MKIVKFAVILLLCGSSYRVIVADSTNSVLATKFAKTFMDRSRSNIVVVVSEATNSPPVFTNTNVALSGKGNKSLGFKTLPLFEDEPLSHLTRIEDPADLNFVEDAIDRVEIVTELYRGGKERASDNVTLRMFELGPKSHFDWFINNNYPAHPGDIGKDEWVIGFKITVTPRLNHKWRSR